MIHIDLYGVNMKKAVIVKVPLEMTGDAIGVKEEGGILNQVSQDIEIKCLPMEIPNVLEVDISNLSIGDTLTASQVVLGDSLELMSAEDMLIISVTMPMKEVQPEADESLEEGEESEEGDAEKTEASSNESASEDSENK